MGDFNCFWPRAGTVIVKELLMVMDVNVLGHLSVVVKSIGEDMIH
jgi:hypothetical protein